MTNYELMYIVDPAAEEGIDGVKQKIEGIITGREGSIHSFEKLGKKRLAYPIAKKQYGIYYLVILEGNGKIVQALESFLLLNSIVLRHIVLAFTDKELNLRNETDRIQQEEAERMRLGGRPLTSGDEDSETSGDADEEKPSDDDKGSIDAESKNDDSSESEAESSTEAESVEEPAPVEEKPAEEKPVEDETPESVAPEVESDSAKQTDAEESKEADSPVDDGEVSKEQTVG